VTPDKKRLAELQWNNPNPKTPKLNYTFMHVVDEWGEEATPEQETKKIDNNNIIIN
jgi:hypothetical protein